MGEVLQCYDDNQGFRSMLRLLDIGRGDLELLFEILDRDGDGAVSYDEFVEQLHYVKSFDSHTLLIFIRFYCQGMLTELEAMHKKLKGQYQESIDLEKEIRS